MGKRVILANKKPKPNLFFGDRRGKTSVQKKKEQNMSNCSKKNAGSSLRETKKKKPYSRQQGAQAQKKTKTDGSPIRETLQGVRRKEANVANKKKELRVKKSLTYKELTTKLSKNSVPRWKKTQGTNRENYLSSQSTCHRGITEGRRLPEVKRYKPNSAVEHQDAPKENETQCPTRELNRRVPKIQETSQYS